MVLVTFIYLFNCIKKPQAVSPGLKQRDHSTKSKSTFVFRYKIETCIMTTLYKTNLIKTIVFNT